MNDPVLDSIKMIVDSLELALNTMRAMKIKIDELEVSHDRLVRRLSQEGLDVFDLRLSQGADAPNQRPPEV